LLALLFTCFGNSRTPISVIRGQLWSWFFGSAFQANPRRVFISGQKRDVFGVIKRELPRRSAIELIIGHMKAEGHLGRCFLKDRAGDAANVSSQPWASAASSPG
jgi:hypothetical protein